MLEEKHLIRKFKKMKKEFEEARARNGAHLESKGYFNGKVDLCDFWIKLLEKKLPK